MLATSLITTAILIGYLFVKSVLDHKASVHAEEHRAFGVFGDVVEVPVGRLPSGPGCHRFAAEPSFTVSGKAGIPDAKSPPAETFERGGTGAWGGRGASTLKHSGTPNQRPLGSAL